MMGALSRLEVVALCPNDDVFMPPRTKNAFKKIKVEQIGEPEEVTEKLSTGILDKSALEIYKKIPPDNDISIELLVDEKYNLREVMKRLLKLEMDGFVVLLPGETVARKSK